MSANGNATKEHVRLVQMTKGGSEEVLAGWGTESSGYDPEDFYTGASDGRGHSANMQCPIPVTVAAELEQMIAAKEFPAYRTRQDFIRDAIVHRINQLADHRMASPTRSMALKSLGAMLVAMARTEQAVQEVETARYLLDSARQALHQVSQAGDNVHFYDLLDMYEEQATNMTEPWRGQLEALVGEFRRFAR